MKKVNILAKNVLQDISAMGKARGLIFRGQRHLLHARKVRPSVRACVRAWTACVWLHDFYNVVLLTSSSSLEGHFCPNGTRHSSEHPCPKGTFNNMTGLEQEAECLPCLPGQFCGTPGLSKPTGECQAG